MSQYYENYFHFMDTLGGSVIIYIVVFNVDALIIMNYALQSFKTHACIELGLEKLLCFSHLPCCPHARIGTRCYYSVVVVFQEDELGIHLNFIAFVFILFFRCKCFLRDFGCFDLLAHTRCIYFDSSVVGHLEEMMCSCCLAPACRLRLC